MDVVFAMGGAGAFCANLGSALPNVTASYYSAAPLSREVAKRFSAGVGILDVRGRRLAPGSCLYWPQGRGRPDADRLVCRAL